MIFLYGDIAIRVSGVPWDRTLPKGVTGISKLVMAIRRFGF